MRVRPGVSQNQSEPLKSGLLVPAFTTKEETWLVTYHIGNWNLGWCCFGFPLLLLGCCHRTFGPIFASVFFFRGHGPSGLGHGPKKSAKVWVSKFDLPPPPTKSEDGVKVWAHTLSTTSIAPVERAWINFLLKGPRNVKFHNNVGGSGSGKVQKGSAEFRGWGSHLGSDVLLVGCVGSMRQTSASLSKGEKGHLQKKAWPNGPASRIEHPLQKQIKLPFETCWHHRSGFGHKAKQRELRRAEKAFPKMPDGI